MKLDIEEYKKEVEKNLLWAKACIDTLDALIVQGETIIACIDKTYLLWK